MSSRDKVNDNLPNGEIIKEKNLTVCPEKNAVTGGASAELRRLFPYTPECSSLIVECPASDYSASSIARAVEDCNAHLLNLNVTDMKSVFPGNVVIDLRIDHRDSDAVSRSLERYGYSVTSRKGELSESEQRARDNAMELLHYLEM